jgi:hypothetical protein
MEGGQDGGRETPRPRARPWVLVLLLGLLVQLPTLGVGFFADDYAHQLVLEDERGLTPIPRWNLYDFGSAADWSTGERAGSLPWWTSEDWSIRFFRPLTSAVLRLDHALWGHGAAGYHATSVLLWLALLVLVHELFLALVPAPRTATLALLVFVLSDASSVPVGWIANRNALVEALFATGALLAALSGKGALALVLGLGAALGKESGSFAWLVAAMALHARGSRRAAAAGALLFVAHLACLALGGFGTRSLLYATPWTDPARFLSNVLTLASAGVLSLLGPLPLDLLGLLPALRAPLVVAGIVLGWPLAVWIARRAPSGPARRLLLAWIALTLLPQGSVVAADRLLFVPSIGAAGLFALAWTAERERWGTLPRLRRALAWALALSVTLGSGFSLVLQNVGSLPGLARHLRAKALATDVGPRALGRRDVIVLQTESQLQAFTLGATWRVETGDEDVRFWPLQSGGRALRWTRTGDATFELETRGAPFLTGPFETVYVSGADPPAVGRRWRTPLFEVEALDAGEDGLRCVRVTLARSLDDPALRFVRPVEGVLTTLAAPAPGATLELPEAVPSRPFVP